MVNYISGLVFVVLLLLGMAVTTAIGQNHVPAAVIFAVGWLFLDVVVSSAIHTTQWRRRSSFGSANFT